MDKEQAQTRADAFAADLREQAEAIYETRKFAGNCPRWYRRRDARTEVVNQFTGRKDSDRTGRRAKFVVDNGIPALLKAMNAGAIKIGAAVEIAALTHDDQHKVMA